MVHNRRDGCSRLAERERESLHARIEELDLEQPIDDGFRLPDELIEALLGNRAVALVIHVDATSAAWWLSIYEHCLLYTSDAADE